MNRLDGSRKDGKKKKLRMHFENYQMNYLIEFDLNIHIILIVYIFRAKIIFKLMGEDNKKRRCPSRYNKHIITINNNDIS